MLQLAPSPDDKILDIGCSTADLATLLRNKYGVRNVISCDSDAELAVDQPAIQLLSAENLHSIPNGSQTKVIYSHSLEHTTDRPAALAEAYRVLEEDGELHILFFLYSSTTIRDPSVQLASSNNPAILTQEQLETEIEAAGFFIVTSQVSSDLSSQFRSKQIFPSVMILARKLKVD